MRSSGDNVAHRASREAGPYREHERDGEQGVDGTANRCELRINVVKHDERSRADALEPKGMGTGRSAAHSDLADTTVPGGEAEPTPSGHSDETGQTRRFPFGEGVP